MGLDTNSIIPARSIDTPRALKVICIGAGISGILTAIQLPRMVQKLELVIYDKNENIGGTWFENRYPGCACDIPSHCYQLSFESNPAWTTYYASQPEILKYWEAVCEKYDVYKYVRLEHHVKKAEWDQTASQWMVMGTYKDGSRFNDRGDVLISAAGLLNKWDWPKINGLREFKGELIHTADWKDDFVYKDKRIAVLGAGSSGIQVVPKLQPKVSRLDHYIRGRTWITTGIADSMVGERQSETGNFAFTKDEIQSWIKHPGDYFKFRKGLEQELQSGHPITVKNSPAQQGARQAFIELMKQRLNKKPQIADHLIPGFSPLCKRFTPGPGYLESLVEDNVDVIVTGIEAITATGIRTVDGRLREVDAIVCATGFDTSFHNRFPTIGRKGLDLNDKWRKSPDTYLGIVTDDFPNYFIFLGPNSAQGAGNLLILMEQTAKYIAQCLEKMQTENVQTMVPKPSSVKNFTQFCDTYFEGTVFSEECSSWYKTGGTKGRVSALWPGSSLHAVKALERPRWEDYDYTYVDGQAFAWFGDGWSLADRSDTADRAYYIQAEQLLL